MQSYSAQLANKHLLLLMPHLQRELIRCCTVLSKEITQNYLQRNIICNIIHYTGQIALSV